MSIAPTFLRPVTGPGATAAAAGRVAPVAARPAPTVQVAWQEQPVARAKQAALVKRAAPADPTTLNQVGVLPKFLGPKSVSVREGCSPVDADSCRHLPRAWPRPRR